MKRPLKNIFRLTPFKLSAFLVFGLCLLYFFSPRFFEMMELRSLDVRFFLRGPVEPGPEVAIVAIDEKSVDEIGRWPWSRSKIAELIEALAKDQPKVIAFDVGFFEPDANSNIGLIDRLSNEINRLDINNEYLDNLLNRERTLADNDRILAEEMAGTSVPLVLGYFFYMNRDEGVTHLTPEAVESKIENVKNGTYSFMRLASPNVNPDDQRFFTAFVPEANIPVLVDTSTASGFFNMFPDADGMLRWVPMAIKCRDKYYLPLSMQALRYYMGDVPTSLTITELGVDQASVGDYNMPTDDLGRVLVNYRGPGRTFPHYSVIDILNGSYEPGTFKDRIILVGATAVAIYDLRVTPFDSTFPGIEVHATVVDNTLRDDFLVRPGWAVLYDWASIVFLGLFLGLALPRLSAITGPFLGLGLITVWTAANFYFFSQGVWVNFVYPLLTLILVYTSITIFRYVTEEREKKKIKGAFSFYVNPSVVSEMLKNPDKLKLGGDKRVMTVLFSDIRNFTTISEKLDPEALVHLLNQYLTVMTNLVFKYDGLVDKYIGDAVMAVWGAPLSQPEHARLACCSALEMMAELRALREDWKQEDPDIPFIDIGIGVNSGPMVVGNMGSESRFDYTVMGDAVNLGSRLEGANKQYGTNILIGEITYEQVNEDFYCRELDSVAVKGKERPVYVYELLGGAGAVAEENLRLARTFHQGLTAYKSRQWDRAFKIFSALNYYYPDDKPVRLYLERVTELIKNPPAPAWDGVFVMKDK